MLGGSESTTGLTCGRRETVEKCGEQPQEPRRKCARRERSQGERGMGAREDGEKRKQHLARGLPLPNCKRNNPTAATATAATAASVASLSIPRLALLCTMSERAIAIIGEPTRLSSRSAGGMCSVVSECIAASSRRRWL